MPSIELLNNQIKYIIRNKTIKFNDDFNEPLDDYGEILSNYKIVEFGLLFNKPIEHLPDSLTHLTFGWYFNKSVLLPNSLIDLIFGNFFNQSVLLPNSLIYLTFGWHFNQSVLLPNSLTHLTFGYAFDKNIRLPTFLTHLICNKNFNKNIELPENLLFIKIFNPTIEIIEKIPNSVKELWIYCFHNSSLRLDNLPNSIEKLEMYCCDDYQIITPASLKCLKINDKEIQFD